MSLNIPGLVVMALFYLVILGTGIWASMCSRRMEQQCTVDGMELTLLAGRKINLLVGIFTLTGGFFFAKPMRENKYMTMMDPFQKKYGNVLSCALIFLALVAKVLWVARTLVSLGLLPDKWDVFDIKHGEAQTAKASDVKLSDTSEDGSPPAAEEAECQRGGSIKTYSKICTISVS